MKREAAVVLAPLAGGVLVVGLSYFTAGFQGIDSSDIAFAVVLLGFPLALVLSLLSGLFIQPWLSKRGAFNVLSVSVISGGMALGISLLLGLPLLFVVAGSLWGLFSGAIYRVLVNQPAL